MTIDDYIMELEDELVTLSAKLLRDDNSEAQIVQLAARYDAVSIQLGNIVGIRDLIRGK